MATPTEAKDVEAQQVEAKVDSPAEDAEKQSETTATSAGKPSVELVDQTNYLPPRQIIIVCVALNCALFLAFLDQTAVSTALPSIVQDFSSDSEAGRLTPWIASAYLLTSTAFQPTIGRLSDIFGRKFVLQGCIIVFAVGSLACAVARTMIQLIIFRALQGVGGGGLVTLVLIIVSDIVSLRERGRYQGILEVVIAISNGIGPVLGGVISEKASWRYIFYLNLPLCAISIIVIARFLPLKRVGGGAMEKLVKIDYLGSALTILATVLLMLALNWGGITYDWNSVPVLISLIASFVVFAVFFFWEWKGAVLPIIPVYIFQVRTVVGVFIVTLISGMAVLTQIFYIPQYIQVVRGLGAIESGVIVIPLLIVVTFMVFVSGQIVARTGFYLYSIIVGYAIWTIGLGLLSTINPNTSTAKLIGFLVVVGLGQGQTLQTTLIAAQAACERAEMSSVTSTRNFLRSLGGTIALALASTIINNTLRTSLTSQGYTSDLINTIINDPTAIWNPNSSSQLFDLSSSIKGNIVQAYTEGFNTVFRMYVGLIGFNLIVTIFLIKQLNLSRANEEELKAKGKEDWAAKIAKDKGESSKDSTEGEEGSIEMERKMEVV